MGVGIDMKVDFPEITTNPDLIREEIKSEMVNNNYPFFGFYFDILKDSDEFRKLPGSGEIKIKYSVEVLDTDLLPQVTENEYEKGWPTGLMPRLKLSCLNHDITQDVKNVYVLMAQKLCNQMCDQVFNAIKSKTHPSDEMVKLSKTFTKWRFGSFGQESSNLKANPIQNLKDLCDVVDNKRGEKLCAVYVNAANYDEFLSHIQNFDINEPVTEDARKIYSRVVYLKDLSICLIGTKRLPEGSIVGVCNHFGNPEVRFVSVLNERFGKLETAASSTTWFSDIKPNIPLNVNLYQLPVFEQKDDELTDDDPRAEEIRKICIDLEETWRRYPGYFLKDLVNTFSFEGERRKQIVEVWIDLVVHIDNENSAFYLEDVI